VDYSMLGNSGLRVSMVCFGALTIGPTQRNMTVKDGSRVIARAIDLGINFIDTAKTYGTYGHIRQALKDCSGSEVIISSKSHAFTWDGMKADFEECLSGLGRDMVDIYLLHEQESRLTLKGHRPALEYLLSAKEKGMVRAIGISSHAVEAVEAAAEMDEIDVIHPLVNQRGIGILDGTREDMLLAIHKAAAAGKGIYAMKPLGGGLLIPQAREAFRWVLDNPDIHSVAIGMQSEAEVEANVAWAENREPGDGVKGLLSEYPRRLLISNWCEGCGACAQRCGQKAIRVIDGIAQVDPEKCVLCGYCAPECREFCIKIV
jgi:aryl-alcohol dehydrogenase-like predicted oxidoreductase/NAD-dependent dihydropyrimidine dehydrogenase PreA subunit